MASVHTFPDQRIPKAVDEIVQILYDIEPPIHTATANFKATKISKGISGINGINFSSI